MAVEGWVREITVDERERVPYPFCSRILMLCDVNEAGKKKCEQYWPTEQGQEVSEGSTVEKSGTTGS